MRLSKIRSTAYGKKTVAKMKKQRRAYFFFPYAEKLNEFYKNTPVAEFQKLISDLKEKTKAEPFDLNKLF